MDSLGGRLRQAREERGLTIEQCARDTHIAKRYIEALEQELFDEFPGEAYLLGFLRNYGRYLELDENELVTAYRNIKIQEQPAPIEDLLDTRGERRWRPYALAAVGVVVVAAIGFGVYTLLTRERPAVSEEREASTEAREAIYIEQQFVERAFDQGALLSFPVGEDEYQIEISLIQREVTFTTPLETLSIEVGGRSNVDLDGDGTDDLSITVRTVDAENGRSVVRFDRALQAPDRSDGSAAIAESATQIDNEEARTIAVFDQPEEYFVEADFRGYCLFRYEIDERSRQERYLQAGDRVRDSVREEARIWASNAGNVRLRVAGYPIELGDNGEVIAADIVWARTPDGRFALDLVPLY